MNLAKYALAREVKDLGRDANVSLQLSATETLDGTSKITHAHAHFSVKPSQATWCGSVHVGAGYHAFDQEPMHKAVVSK